MPLSASRREIASRAMVVIATVVTVFFCSAWVYNQYIEVKDQSAEIQTRVFRDTLAIFRDLWHLEHVLDRVIEAGNVTDQDIFEFSQRLDFLYVRAEELKIGAGDHADTAPFVDKVVNDLNSVISAGDRIVSRDLADPVAYFKETRPYLKVVSREVMALFDSQYIRQSEAISSQITILKKLTFSAIALLGLFGGITAGVTFILQRQLQIQAKRREAEDKANFLAFFDGLTGLPNRDKFRSYAQDLIDRNNDPIVFLFDLDDFKLVNDIHGHLAGDAVLVQCAEYIKLWADEHGGTPSRLGGDEFAAVLPGPMSSMKIASMCEALLDNVTRSFEYEGVLLTPKMSIGVAASWSLETESALDLSALQKAADIALYRAKDQGKNTYAFFDGDLAQIAARRRDLELGIDEALENEGFSLAYQPQVEMTTGQVRGFECLARWIKDDEIVSPGEFIPVAESTGQVVEIDLWAMRRSTKQMSDWISDGRLPVSISTNLSPLHFRNDDIVGHVEQALISSRLPPHLLTLEITESVLIEDLSKVTATLEKLRNLGVRIALDDFGTGYSSLAYLRKLDVDYIKIDQSFVRDLEESAETQLILDALVDIAKGLKKMLVVEGIETESQAEIIRNLGCDIGQGYLWGKPMGADEGVEMLPNIDDVLMQLEKESA